MTKVPMSSNSREAVEAKIKEVLRPIRPYLQADGGDVELLKVSPDMHVHLKLLGSCQHCPINRTTLESIENSIKTAIPAVTKIHID